MIIAIYNIKFRNLPYQKEKKYYDMSATIHAIMNSKTYTTNNMRLMFYNGDVDTVCQFLGDQWFIENLVVARNLTVRISSASSDLMIGCHLFHIRCLHLHISANICPIFALTNH